MRAALHRLLDARGGTATAAELLDLKRLILSLREIRRARPHQPITLEVHEAAAVDVASGVESAPGKKDSVKVRDFVANALGAFEALPPT